MSNGMFNNLEDKYIKLIEKSDLFDPDWYLKKYPDVAMSGIDPAYHFLKYGTLLSRDPGPEFSSSFYYDVKGWVKRQGMNPLLHLLTRKKLNLPKPDNILWAANKVAEKGDYNLAVKLAEENLPFDLHYTIELIKANAALHRGNEKKWLSALNKYLVHFDVYPIELKGSDEQDLLSRFCCKKMASIDDECLVSIIMPVWNSEESVYYAVQSILNQTWRNIELIIIDDCSTDETWKVLEKLQKTDSRINLIRNKVNVGPYVSKNKGLDNAGGRYVTGHDADDWAHPQRIEKHMELIRKNGSPRASLTHMVRVKPDGFFGHIGKITGFSFDGAARKASISCMFEKQFLTEVLGYWDSVRFGADSEMIARAEKILGNEFKIFKQIGMICLDLETSLTNHPSHGIRSNNGGLSDSRKVYRDSWVEWHANELCIENAYLPFPLSTRRYTAHEEMQVPYSSVIDNG